MIRCLIVHRLALPAALAVAAALSIPQPASAASPPSARGPVARVGDRTIDEADLRAAAAAMASDPLRRKNPALWRKALVERCVDRELLAMEAERRGYLGDPRVRSRIGDREYALFLGELYQRVLIPGIEPTQAQLDSLRATGLFRGLDLDYILMAPPAVEDAKRVAEHLRRGARFDSTARQWSQHPSKADGGHYGWVLVRELDPRSHTALRDARPGEVLGPYSGPYGNEIYGVRQFQEIPPDSLSRLVKEGRTRGLLRHYQAGLLRQYHFALDTTQVNAVLFIAATEPVDRILASLGPDGTRPAQPGQRALGVVARVDGDSITFRDLAQADQQSWHGGGKMRLRDRAHLAERCGATLIPSLVLRDARDRGLDKDPQVARALRLICEEEGTRAMAARESGGPPDSAATRAFFAKNPARYRRPEAVRARAVCFAADSVDAAQAALRSWLVAGAADTTLEQHGFTPQPRASATTLWPQRYGEVTVLASDADPVALAVRGLDRGQLSPAVRSVQGIVVAEALEREAPRALTFEEVAPGVARDAAEALEDRWIARILPKLRAATKIEIATARLAQVRLDPDGAKKGSR